MVSVTPKSQNGTDVNTAQSNHFTPVDRRACRYLGLDNDKETWFSFPSTGNCCHFVKKIEPVDIEHQQHYCLNSNHTACPVLELQNRKQLPKRVAGYYDVDRRRRWIRPVAAGILLLVIMLALAVFLLPQTSLSALGHSFFRDGTSEEGFFRGNVLSMFSSTAPTPSPVAVAAGAIQTATSTSTPAPTQTAPPSPTSTTTPLPPSPTATMENTATVSATMTVTPAAPSGTPTPDIPQIEVNVSMLNVRSGPGIDYPILITVIQGIQLNLTGRNRFGDWFQICCLDNAGTAGWVFSESVLIDGEIDEVPIITDITPPPPTETP